MQVCFSAIDTQQQVTVKSTSSFVNQPTGFQTFFQWVSKHRKEDLPLRYVMESTGVYHEQVAWYLYQQDQSVSVLLPNKANRTADAALLDEPGAQIEKRWQRPTVRWTR